MKEQEMYAELLTSAHQSEHTFAFPNHHQIIDILEENDTLSDTISEIRFRNLLAVTVADKTLNGYMFLLNFIIMRDQFQKSNPDKAWVATKAYEQFYDIANVLISDEEVRQEATNCMRFYTQQITHNIYFRSTAKFPFVPTGKQSLL